MPSVTLHEAQARLPKLIADLLPGEELRILHETKTVATLVKTWTPTTAPRRAGNWPKIFSAFHGRRISTPRRRGHLHTGVREPCQLACSTRTRSCGSFLWLDAKQHGPRPDGRPEQQALSQPGQLLGDGDQGKHEESGPRRTPLRRFRSAHDRHGTKPYDPAHPEHAGMNCDALSVALPCTIHDQRSV